MNSFLAHDAIPFRPARVLINWHVMLFGILSKFVNFFLLFFVNFPKRPENIWFHLVRNFESSYFLGNHNRRPERRGREGWQMVLESSCITLKLSKSSRLNLTKFWYKIWTTVKHEGSSTPSTVTQGWSGQILPKCQKCQYAEFTKRGREGRENLWGMRIKLKV